MLCEHPSVEYSYLLVFLFLSVYNNASYVRYIIYIISSHKISILDYDDLKHDHG